MAIETRHQTKCRKAVEKEARCNCKPSYRVAVYSGKQGTRRLKTFPSHAAALSFETAAKAAQRPSLNGTNVSLTEAMESLFEGMRLGTVLNRKREQYKSGVVDGYERDFKNHIKEDLGAMRLDRIERRHIQALVDKKRAKLSAGTMWAVLMPLFVVYRRALRDETIMVNPCEHLDLESKRGEKRIEIADPDHARKCIAALPLRIGATYGCALFAGLRVGEISALRWEHILWDDGVILVQQGYDQNKRLLQSTKSREWRRVPLLSELREMLKTWQSESGETTGWVFPRRDGQPFTSNSYRTQADRCWKRKKMGRIRYHDCRHVFVSICIDAGLNLKQIGSFIGHKSITTTMDTYGHLLPGSEASAGEIMDAYLSKKKGPSNPPV